MRNLTYEQKLAGFPTVNYISLVESQSRRDYMEAQFTKYGISAKSYLFNRYTEIMDGIRIRFPSNILDIVSPLQVGAITSHIQMMLTWYHQSREQYAIFCDDDINFGSIDHWNFTWQEFIQNLPRDYAVIQLIRMDHEVTPERVAQLGSLQLKTGRWWGAAWMMHRDYVKHLLNILLNEDGSYNLVSMNGTYMPILENVMLLNGALVYNFPLFTEANETHETTYVKPNSTDEEMRAADWSYRNRRVFCRLVEHYWENTGSTLNIKESMRV